MEGIRITHIGGPTVLIEVGGWRLLTDPTFDAPGRKYNFGWGTSSRKLAGPAIAAGDLGQIDAVLLSHDHHDDNLDDAGRALLPSAGTVVTTVPGAKRLGGNARGIAGLGLHHAGGVGADPDRGDGDALPAWAAAEPPDRRRGRRLRPALGRPGARGALDLRRHRPL
jgi:L-ascorbate metabolism protein UlaG (beta-lactamase superfamily)